MAFPKIASGRVLASAFVCMLFASFLVPVPAVCASQDETCTEGEQTGLLQTKLKPSLSDSSSGSGWYITRPWGGPQSCRALCDGKGMQCSEDSSVIDSTHKIANVAKQVKWLCSYYKQDTGPSSSYIDPLAFNVAKGTCYYKSASSGMDCDSVQSGLKHQLCHCKGKEWYMSSLFEQKKSCKALCDGKGLQCSGDSSAIDSVAKMKEAASQVDWHCTAFEQDSGTDPATVAPARYDFNKGKCYFKSASVGMDCDSIVSDKRQLCHCTPPKPKPGWYAASHSTSCTKVCVANNLECSEDSSAIDSVQEIKEVASLLNFTCKSTKGPGKWSIGPCIALRNGRCFFKQTTAGMHCNTVVPKRRANWRKFCYCK